MEGGVTSYDEDLTPGTDPPVIEPPPAATLLGRIFAHRRDRGTVLRAPLVPVNPPEPVADRDTPDSEETDVAGQPLAEPAGAEPPPVPHPVPRPVPSPIPQPDAEPAPRVAARYCPACDERVPLAADGLHCSRGHRLSPAHAKRRRGWFRRRS